MAFDEKLAARIRAVIDGRDGVAEKRMFGGVCFMAGGNIACGVVKDELVVRVGPEAYQATLKQANTREFDITGRAMKGWVFVEKKGMKTKAALAKWVEKGLTFAFTLPAK